MRAAPVEQRQPQVCQAYCSDMLHDMLLACRPSKSSLTPSCPTVPQPCCGNSDQPQTEVAHGAAVDRLLREQNEEVQRQVKAEQLEEAALQAVQAVPLAAVLQAWARRELYRSADTWQPLRPPEADSTQQESDGSDGGGSDDEEGASRGVVWADLDPYIFPIGAAASHCMACHTDRSCNPTAAVALGQLRISACQCCLLTNLSATLTGLQGRLHGKHSAWGGASTPFPEAASSHSPTVPALWYMLGCFELFAAVLALGHPPILLVQSQRRCATSRSAALGSAVTDEDWILHGSELLKAEVGHGLAF